MELSKRTFFFKASHPLGAQPKLDPIWIAKNHARGVMTTLLLDTNILIDIEKVVKSGNKTSAIKDKGLHNLISLLYRIPPGSVYLSPGFAFDEMPPALAEQSRQYYEIFCAKHLPHFYDSPGSIQTTYEGKSHNYGFFDLEQRAQAVLAIPFCSLVYLQLVDRMAGLKPIEKFKRYLAMAVDELDILSSKEVEIARYCFANPPASCTKTIALRKVIRRNFVQTKDKKLPRDAAQLIGIAFNGACDLNLMNCANGGDNNAIDGIEQDCWITTRDEKLFKFGELAHCLNIGGTAGMLATISELDEHALDPYWNETTLLFQDLIAQRTNYIASRKFELMSYPTIAERATALANEAFAN